jgi:uncharacterized membrane protein YbhN (UPF0104 family)
VERLLALRESPAASRAFRAVMIVGGLAAMGGIVWVAKESNVEVRGREAAGLFIVAGLFLTVMPLVGAARWAQILRMLGERQLRYGALLRALLLARFAGTFTSSIGADIVGRFALASRSISSRRVLLGSLACDRGFDAVYAAALIPAAVLVITGLSHSLAVAALAVGMVAPLALIPLAGRTRLASRVEKRFLTLSTSSAREVRSLWLLTVVRSVSFALAAYAVAQAFNLPISVFEMLAVAPIIQLTVIVSFTPGGLGINEAGWIGVLTAMGMAPDEAAGFAVAYRIVQVATFGAGAVVTTAWSAWSARADQGNARSTAREGLIKTRLTALVGDDPE